MAAQVLSLQHTTTHMPSSPYSSASLTSRRKPTPPQRTNHGSYIEPDMVDWLTPTTQDTPLSDIQTRYARDGYVWLKNVIPHAEVLDMRELYFETLSPTGLLAPNTSLRDGLFNPSLDPAEHQGLGATPRSSAMDNLDKYHASRRYQQFIDHPNLRDWVCRLRDWQDTVVLKRGLVRHNVPGSTCPSGIHYDQLFLRAGDPTFVTAWVPLGDCAADGGGLMYLENSCALGETIEKRFESQQEKEGMPREERINAFNRHMGKLGHLSHNAETWAKEDGQGKRWLIANYEAGDVVFHSPWMIHSSSQNSDKSGRIRLASDLRFYEKGANLDKRWTEPFHNGDGL